MLQQLIRDGIAITVLVCFALAGAWLAHSPFRSAAFDLAGDERSLRRAGFYALEDPPAPIEPFRWAAGNATITLPNPGGALWLTLRLQGPNAPGVATLNTHAGTFALPLTPTARRYRLLVPPAPGEQIALRLAAPVIADANSQRDLGVQVRSATVHGGGAAPLAVAASLSGGVITLFLALRAGGVRRTLACALTALMIGVPLIWQALGGWRSGLFAPRVLTGALVGGVAVLGWVLLQCLRNEPAAAQTNDQRPTTNDRRPLSRSQDQSSIVRRISSFILHPSSFILALYLGLALWNSFVVHPALDPDLVNYLIAGADVLRGDNPYGRFSLDLIGAGFVYTPATLPLFALLSRLPFPEIWAIWFVGNLALYLIALLAIWLSLPNRPGINILLVTVVVALGSTTFLEALAIGQINSLMLLGMALFLYGHTPALLRSLAPAQPGASAAHYPVQWPQRRSHAAQRSNRRMAWLGDIALAGAILIKLTPAVLLLWPLVRRDWPRLGRVTIGLALLCVPALLAFGFTPWLQFIVLLPSLLQGPTSNPYNQSLAAVLTALAPTNPLWGTLASLLGRIFTLVLLGTWAVHCWRMRAQSGPGPLALGVLALTVGSNLVWHHHLMFLLVPALWLFFTATPGTTQRLTVLGALGFIQISRLVERSLDLPAVTAVAGYLILFSLFVWAAGSRQQAAGGRQQETV